MSYPQRPLAFIVLLWWATFGVGQDAAPSDAIRFGNANWRHGHQISNAEMSPDGRLLATASKSSVRVWNLDTGRARHEFHCDHGPIFCCPRLCFSSDGGKLGYVRGSDFACVWDLSTGRELLRINDERNGPVCAFTPDGKQFLASARESLHAWDLTNGQRVRNYQTGYFNLLSPDQKSYVHVEEKRTVVLRELETGKETARWNVAAYHDGIRNGAAFSPDGKQLAVIDNDAEIHIKEIADGNITKKFPLPVSAQHEVGLRTYFEYRISFSADGSELLLATVGGLIFRWDLTTGKELPRLSKHCGNVTAVFKRPGGKMLVSTGTDGLVRRWDAVTGREAPGFDGYVGRTFAAMSPEGRLIAVGDARGRIDLWDANGKRQSALLRDGAEVTNVAFAPDGEIVATGAIDGAIRIWSVSNGKLLRVWEAKSPPNSTWSFGCAMTLLFSGDGRYLCVSDYPNAMRMYEVATGRLVWGGKRDARAAFSSDGRTLATLYGRHLRFLDLPSGEERARVQLNIDANDGLGTFEDAVCFSPDGQLYGALADGHIVRCDGQTGVERGRFVAATTPVPQDARMRMFMERSPKRVASLSVAPHGQWLASGATDNTVRIWEAMTGRELWRRDLDDAGASRVNFGPDGRTLLTCGQASHVYLWHLDPKTKDTRAFEYLWRDLRSEDGPTVFKAIWAMSERPDAGMFLRRQIVPVSPPDSGKVKTWIEELNSPMFARREEAQKHLAELGELASAELVEALAKNLSAESRKRIAQLLGVLNGSPPADRLRQHRAVCALALSNSDEARTTLRLWAAGAEGATLTRLAKVALK